MVWCSDCAFNHCEECWVVGSDVGATGSFGVDELTLTFVVFLALVNGNFESSGLTIIHIDVIGELAGHFSLDLFNCCVDLGNVASSAAVFELHRVGSGCVYSV